MKTNFTIKNFRVFDENGVDIDLAPITILTGKNSAGKSSIVKAISILNSFLKQIRRDKENGKAIELHKYKIQFNELFERTLGSFTDVLHRGSENHLITFEYVIHSTMLFEDVKISFSFKDADEGKDDARLHYAILSALSVRTLQDEAIYFSNDEGEFCCNLNLFKKSFYDFAIGESLAHGYLGVLSDEEGTREEKRKIASIAKEELDKLDEIKRKNIYRYLRDPFSSKTPIIREFSLLEEMISSVNDDKQIFYIPVINECLAKLDKGELSKKTDEILEVNNALDCAEKYVIKHLISDILATGKRIDDFWQEQEKAFLGSVGKEITQTKEQKTIAIFHKLAKKGVCLPNPFMLMVGDGFWESYPGLWQMDGEDKERKSKDIDKWKETPLDSFPKMYEVFMRLNTAYEKWMENNQSNYTPCKVYFYEEGIENPAGRYTHLIYQMLCEYASRAIENILFPVWTENFNYIPSSRALPKRLYTPETGKDFYATLNKYMIAKTEYVDYLNSFRGSNKKPYIADSFLNKWIGKDGFEICKSISVESVMGSAIVVKLIKEGGHEVYLTDEGYGLTQLLSILISIETAILNARGVNYNNYLYQSDLDGLNTNEFYYEQQTIAVEEPEIHLHPAFQSKLADMFASAAEYNIHFIVETHSEYLIRKTQVLVATSITNNSNISIYFLSNKINKYSNSEIRKIRIRKNGTLDGFFDKGFFDEASERSLDLLRMGGEDDE